MKTGPSKVLLSGLIPLTGQESPCARDVGQALKGGCHCWTRCVRRSVKNGLMGLKGGTTLDSLLLVV